MADKEPKKKGEVDDYGFKETDEKLKDIEARLSSLYADASKDMEKKLNDFLDQFKEMDEAFAQNVKDGIWTADMYKEWRDVEIMRSEQMRLQIEQLTEDLVKTDVEAMQIVNGELPDIFVTNYNYQGYKAEQICAVNGIEMNSFTIYNKDAVARIVREDPDLLPAPKVDLKADKKWNKQKINTAIAQGITQGESMDKIAARLQAVTDMDYNAAIRNARTATIGAQNAGRADASERIRKSGLDLDDVWSAVHDARTRETHILLDGQKRENDGYFHSSSGAKLRYPCDPQGAAGEIYNCRCRLNLQIAGVDHSKDDELYEKFMQENYYNDWLAVKEQNERKEKAFRKNADEAMLKDYMKNKDASSLLPAEELTSGKRGVVQGKDISNTWTRREEQFAFEIDDVIDAQGFNGLPRVVSEEEFNKAVAESNIVMQRAYNAPNKETLDDYRNSLYYGDWYVDCSQGGASYGQGMYAMANYEGKVDKRMSNFMEHYSTRFNKEGVAAVETFTLTPDAKIISYDDLLDMKNQGGYEMLQTRNYLGGLFDQNGIAADDDMLKCATFMYDNKYGDFSEVMTSMSNLSKEQKQSVQNVLDIAKQNNFKPEEKDIDNDSTLAVLLGYDAISTREEIGEVVVLNRTKLIIKDGRL